MFAFVNQVSVSAASKSKQTTGRVCGLKVEARNLNSSLSGCVSWNSSCVTAAFDSSSSCMGLCWFWFLGHADITPTIRHILVTLFTSHVCRLVTKNKRHKADGDGNSDDYVTDWAFVLIRSPARHRQQRKELSLGDGWNGSVLYHCPKTPKFTGRGRSAP
jgi:hypothetical protein